MNSDLEALRLSQDFGSQVEVKQKLTTVPIRKPHRQWFCRVNPDPEMQFCTNLLEFEADRRTYVVTPDVAAHLPEQVVPASLYLAVNRQGVVFLWPARLAGTDGLQNQWYASMFEAVAAACEQWVRVTSNMTLGAYEVFVAQADLPSFL